MWKRIEKPGGVHKSESRLGAICIVRKSLTKGYAWQAISMDDLAKEKVSLAKGLDTLAKGYACKAIPMDGSTKEKEGLAKDLEGLTKSYAWKAISTHGLAKEKDSLATNLPKKTLHL